jgi:anti-sigma factor RsiW
VAAIAEPQPFAGSWSAGWAALAASLGFAGSWRAGWAAMAASIMIAFAGGSIATKLALGPIGPESQSEMLVASHMRALMATQAVDVVSSDRHTVKPWFNGKLPESPRVVNLAAHGFPLVGGRIDVIGLKPAPVLVYHARLHVISVTALPSADHEAAPPRPINGYNIVEWTDGPTTYWAVSDLNAPELESFAKAFRAGDAEP